MINKKYTLGSWITIGHQSIVEVMADSGFDWLCIDIEHTVIDFLEVQQLISTIAYKGLKSYVRVGGNDEIIIKRVLDAGANGIIVPLIKNRSECEKAISYSLYPPLGRRGVNSLSRAQKYGFGFDEYLDRVNIDTEIIAQIEHIDAINDLNNILETKNLTGTIIGPYDLSASMGLPGDYDNPRVKEAINKYEEISDQYNLLKGYHVIKPDANLVKEKIDKGYNFIAFSWDTYFIGNACRQEIKKL